LARLEVLVVDDWAMAPLADAERRDFLEICEDRYQRRSTILTSQLPVAKWHEQIGDPTWPIAFSTGWCTTLTASRCTASRCAKSAAARNEQRRCAPNSLSGAVEMPPHGKRGKLPERVSHPFHRAWKSGKGRPDSHISTAPAAGLFIRKGM